MSAMPEEIYKNPPEAERQAAAIRKARARHLGAQELKSFDADLNEADARTAAIKNARIQHMQAVINLAAKHRQELQDALEAAPKNESSPAWQSDDPMTAYFKHMQQFDTEYPKKQAEQQQAFDQKYQGMRMDTDAMMQDALRRASGGHGTGRTVTENGVDQFGYPKYEVQDHYDRMPVDERKIFDMQGIMNENDPSIKDAMIHAIAQRILAETAIRAKNAEIPEEVLNKMESGTPLAYLHPGEEGEPGVLETQEKMEKKNKGFTGKERAAQLGKTGKGNNEGAGAIPISEDELPVIKKMRKPEDRLGPNNPKYNNGKYED